LYVVMVVGAFLCAVLPWVLGSMSGWLLLCWLAAPLAVSVTGVVRSKVDGPSLNDALAKTGALQLVFCLLFSAGILASGGIGS
jgi:1,4-dihydroxy-2-naphthoate octaprenyltransferase